ncbi:MAG: nicotinamide riboside transporter PnuC [Bacteroidales bacterium]
MLYDWLSKNWIEVFGTITGIIYVFLEIKQNLWLWPVGITTSAVYIWVFFTSKFYADMSLQGYYLVISCLGWYWWVRGSGCESEGGEQGAGSSEGGSEKLRVTRLKFRTGLILVGAFVLLYFILWFVLSHLTDSPVPEWDSFVTSLSIIATWMLARKIYEHWFLWIVVNTTSSILFSVRGLYPTVLLYLVYLIMSFVGLREWKRSL